MRYMMREPARMWVDTISESQQATEPTSLSCRDSTAYKTPTHITISKVSAETHTTRPGNDGAAASRFIFKWRRGQS